MTAEALAKGIELQRQIKAVRDLRSNISETACDLLFCPEGRHYEESSLIPEELAVRPVILRELDAKIVSLLAEFESL